MASATSTSSALLAAAEDGAALSRAEIAALLQLEDDACLLEAADRVRRRCVGEEIFLRGIVEFSSHCRNRCRYCGLRRDNTGLERYRIPEDEVLALAAEIARAGCTTIVLQSGEDRGYTGARLAELVRAIRRATDLTVTLSVGELDYDDYLKLRQAGAERFLLRHETANAELYARLHPGRSLEGRLRCLRWLKSLGFETGAGFMVGLPGQTMYDLAEDILLLRELDVDMIGIGPFIPHPATELQAAPPGDVGLVLRAMAVARLVTCDTNIPATTATGALDPAARLRAFSGGANVFMPNFTPSVYAGQYQIYPGKGSQDLALEGQLADLRDFCGSCGRPLGTSAGSRPQTPPDTAGHHRDDS